MDKAESQGQRLSSYASSSSNKYSPKTPKKSTEKLSTHSTSKEESLSPHHLMSGYSYSSINSQSKELNPECALKCTCNNNSNYNSLKSVKSNTAGVEKTIKVSKISCDAATSPNRFTNHRSPQPNLRLINNKNSSLCNELRISDDKKVINKASPSPRRLVTTRNAATSPHLEVRKHLNQELLPKSPELTGKSLLEKSNSLGESKPSRPLRTTRSLSPRPPVRHQHAIMVSDENDIISVKVSPNEDFDLDFGKHVNEIEKAPKKKHKAQSEQTSPNLSEYNSSFSYDKSTNKSTSCLVYVPSDPWLKMPEIDTDKNANGKNEMQRRIAKISQETRSLSRGNLVPLDSDPWIWRKQENSLNQNNPKRSPKQEAYRQSKSFSATKFEISDTGKSFSLATKNDSNGAKSVNQPKLQRCKSPLILDDEKITVPFNESQLCTCNSANEIKLSVGSQQRKDDSTIKDTSLPPQQNQTFLNVINPNLMQSRHSFSSISQKDDELQLNIRRLSEQIKHNTGVTSGSGGVDFTDYLNQFRSNDAQNFANSPKNSSKKSDSVLETTC